MAVYTKIEQGELKDLISQYNIGNLISIKGIEEGVENSNYLLTTTKDKYILTVYEKRVNPKDLPFFLWLKEHLHDNGILCPLPIKDKKGKVLKKIKGRSAAIVSFLNGKWPKKVENYHCKELGKTLAGCI